MTEKWNLSDYADFDEDAAMADAALANWKAEPFQPSGKWPPQPAGQHMPVAGAAPTFKFKRVGDLEYRAPEFVVDGLIESETLGLIFGEPGCGKSFVAVDLALSVAAGTHFHGRATKQGAVFFIAGEGHNGLARRFAAWGKDRGVALHDAPLFKSERAAQFLDIASAQAVADAVAGLADVHGNPALIIVDTVARNFGAGDENSTKDMSEFVAAIDDLKAQFPGCTVLLVHHSGHAAKDRARGAVALKAALDCEYRVSKDGAQIEVACTKAKDAEAPPDLHFRLKSVDLGDDVSSAVLQTTEAPERADKLTPSQRLALATYTTASVESGIWDDGAFRGVHVDHWRAAFYSKHTGDTPEAKQKAYQRARRDLIDRGAMTVSDDVYLASDAATVDQIIGQKLMATDE